jgi:hypothetical protein
MNRMKKALLAFAMMTTATLVRAQKPAQNSEAKAVYGPELEGYAYPFPVEQFRFSSQKQTLHMAYMCCFAN